MEATRRGKVGRLPTELREQVNRRLEVGQRGATQAAWVILFMCCLPAMVAKAGQPTSLNAVGEEVYPGVPKSSIYDVAVTENSVTRHLTVFQSSCPEYRAGYMNMTPVDEYPLAMFKGRSISWANFSFSNRVTIQIHVLDTNLISKGVPVKIFPTKCGVTPVVQGDVITFSLMRPGQYSVEIGRDGYKRGLLVFANPPETDRPDPVAGNYYSLTNATPVEINAAPATYSGIYFSGGVHDIGVYHVPAQVKNIYLAPDAWVYGAIIMEGRSDVKIFGRGVLSGAKLNYRESHTVEAIRSDRIDVEGIVLADTKHFAVRLLGTNNTVKWVKIVGGWTYNTDGIAAFDGSTVAHCFVWANDDSIKPYRDNLVISDCVVWQLNNGAVIQLGWGNARATNVVIRDVDVLHAEWNNNAANRGILSCIGDKFAKGGMSEWQKSFLIEDVTTETPVPFVFNIRPNPASPSEIHGMTLRNWNIKMDMNRGYPNHIECAEAANRFDEFVFDRFTLNDVTLTESNWITAGRFVTRNLAAPRFAN